LYILCLLALPFGFFAKTRGFVGVAYILASYIFFLTLLSVGFLVTFYYWGVIGVIIGVFMFGAGVVATGALAAIFHADWWVLASLVYMFVLAYGVRLLGYYWVEKSENQ